MIMRNGSVLLSEADLMHVFFMESRQFGGI